MLYKVVKGDNLTKIAKKYNTTVGALVALNGIPNPNVIAVGEVLEIPEPATPGNNQLYNAVISCLDAIQDLPEFKQLEEMLYGSNR